MSVIHEIRTGRKKETRTLELTARRAIIEFCKECVGYNAHEVRDCSDKLCALYPFRTRDKPQDTA